MPRRVSKQNEVVKLKAGNKLKFEVTTARTIAMTVSGHDKNKTFEIQTDFNHALLPMADILTGISTFQPLRL